MKTSETGTMTNRDVAENIAQRAREEGLRARVWHGDICSRVYLERELSRGWQRIGYIHIARDGAVVKAHLTRERAGIARALGITDY